MLSDLFLIFAIFLLGCSGVGKTTLCRKLFEVLKEKGIQIQGFYTEEVRTCPKGSRVGFDVVTLNGQRGVLARIKGYYILLEKRGMKSANIVIVIVRSQHLAK